MNNKKEVQQQFGANADSYVTSQIHKEGKDLQILMNMAVINGHENALDIATGGGHTANALASQVKTVTAFDITSEMLSEAENFIKGNGHQNVIFIKGDAENLPFPDESFEIVTCRIAAHHFPNIRKFIAEAFRVLKQNGQFLLDDNTAPEDDDLDQFYNDIEKKRDYSHYRAWKKSEWLSMLELAGFDIVEWHLFKKTFPFDSWCGRMQLSQTEKEKLTQIFLNATQKAKRKFTIMIKNEALLSFRGEAIVLKAEKN